MESIEDIKKANMLLHGFDISSSPLPVGTEFSEFAYLLSKIEFMNSNSQIKKISKWRMKKDAKEYLDSKIKVRDVRFCKDRMFYKLNGMTVSSVSELASVYNDVSKYVNPFDIPIKYNSENGQFYGLVVFHQGLYDTLEFYKDMLLSITHIELSDKINDLNTSCYLHEIMHTQLIEPKGKVKDYNNGEVLSMFMEFVYLLDKDSSEILLKKTEENKINYFLYEFNNMFKYYYENDGTMYEYQVLKSSKYASSILKAIKLFQIYYYGNISIRREIFSYIQRIIDGSIMLEEMLDHFDVTHESSIDGSIYKYLLRK